MEERKTKLLSRDYVLVMTAAMGTSFVNYFFFSTLTLFAAALTGGAAWGGYLSMAYSIMALISRPTSGFLSDRIGRVKIIIFGAALCVAACIAYGLTTALVLLLFIRAVNGAGYGMSSTCAGAAVPDIVPKEKLAQGVGIFGLYSTVAQAIGPMIALAIIGGGGLGRFNTLFIVSAAFCAVSLISGCLIKYERGGTRRKPETTGAESISAPAGADIESAPTNALCVNAPAKTILGFEPQVFGPGLVLILFFAGLTSILSFFTLYAENRGFSVVSAGWFFFVSAAGMLISRLLFGKVVDRRGGDIVVIPGLIATSACVLIIPFISSLPLLICLGLPYGIANGAVGPSINSMLFKRCSPKRRGGASAAYFASIDIGITLGAPLMGRVADGVSFAWMYWLAAAIIGAAFLIYIFFVSDRRYNYRKN